MAAIAQLVEQLTCNEKVQGSTPCGGTILERRVWKEGSGKKDARLGKDECVLVFVTHGWFVKAVGNENESGVKRECDAPLVLMF